MEIDRKDAVAGSRRAVIAARLIKAVGEFLGQFLVSLENQREFIFGHGRLPFVFCNYGAGWGQRSTARRRSLAWSSGILGVEYTARAQPLRSPCGQYNRPQMC